MRKSVYIHPFIDEMIKDLQRRYLDNIPEVGIAQYLFEPSLDRTLLSLWPTTHEPQGGTGEMVFKWVRNENSPTQEEIEKYQQYMTRLSDLLAKKQSKPPITIRKTKIT